MQANSEKVATFLDKLEKESKVIDGMAEETSAQIKTKLEYYQAFLDKKSKLLSPNSSLLLTAGANMCILLGKMKNDVKMILKREELTRHRLRILEMVDQGNRSRLKGFELFRLFQILEAKSKLIQKDFSEEMRECLVEAHYLIKDDIGVPPPLLYHYDQLLSEPGSHEAVETIVEMLNVKYN